MKLQTFHDTEARQITFLDSRYYTLDHKTYYPSVTTILEVFPKGFGFQQWLKDVGNNATEIVDRAADFGSKIHNLTEGLNNGIELSWADDNGMAKFTLEEWKSLLKFAEFWNICNPDLLANETSFCSPELGIGGTLDRVVRIAGRLCLIDIKTSNYIHKTHELQLAAYAMLWNDKNPEQPIEDTAILWLKAHTRTQRIDPAKGIFQGVGWQLVSFDRHYTDSFRIFQHVHAIWIEENPNYKPANLIYPDSIKL